MSILSTLRTLKAWAINRYNYSAYQTLGARGIQRPADPRSLVNNHFKGWVYICASRNAETIAGIPLRLYARGGTRSYYSRRALGKQQKSYIEQITGKGAEDVEEIVAGHPLIDLLDHMNDEHTRAEVLEGTVTWQEATGDAYWYMEPGAMGLPQAIYPLMSQFMKVVRDGEGRLTGYLYGRDENKRIALEASEVIHFKTANPKNPDYGLSPLEATFGAAVLLESQQEYEQALYDAGGCPEVGLIVKGQLTEDQRKKLYAEWRGKFESKRKGEKFIILQGDMDLKTFGLPPKDVGVQFTQRFSREEICAAYGVPMTLIQLNEASRAGAEAGHYAYMQFTIAPKLRRIAEKLTEQLASKYDDRLFFAFDDPVPENQELRLRQIQTRLQTRMTSINEERALDGMEPVEWGEKPSEPVSPFGLPADEEEEEPEPDTPPEKSVKQMNQHERSFARELNGYFVKMRKQVEENLEQLV